MVPVWSIIGSSPPGGGASLDICRFPLSAHREDIGIECHSLAKLLASKVYWKGVEFSTSSKPTSLDYVEISEAYEAIKGDEFLPDLQHVTVKNSVYAVRSDKMNSPLTISDSSIRGNKFAGIQIKSRVGDAKILNTVVENTTSGDGLSFIRTAPDPKDFCSTDMNNIVFPINLQALGKSRTRVDCAKVGSLMLLCLFYFFFLFVVVVVVVYLRLLPKPFIGRARNPKLCLFKLALKALVLLITLMSRNAPNPEFGYFIYMGTLHICNFHMTSCLRELFVLVRIYRLGGTL